MKVKSLIGLKQIVITFIILVLLVWAALPWEWSTIDDPGFVIALDSLQQEYGARAPLILFWQSLQGDWQWGLFRPSYWLYPSFTYLLPIGLAHSLRLAMVFIAIGGPLVALHRRGVRGPHLVFAALLLLTASHALYTGLVFVSLQELSGAAFVGLGLAVSSSKWRTAAWLVAAWFKSPFSWLLIGDAVVLWRQGHRKHAVLSALLGVVTLLAAFLYSRNSSYTERATFDYGAVWRASENLPKLLEPHSSVILVSLVWWLLWSGSSLTLRLQSLPLAIGWAGYVALMLPWGVTSYYLGPMDYMLGLLLAFSLSRPNPNFNLRRLVIGFTLPAVIASLAVFNNVGEALRWSTTLKTITSCITEDLSPRVLVTPDIGTEAPGRIRQNAQIAVPGWNGSVELALAHESTDVIAADFYVAFGSDPGIDGIEPICVAPDARVYSLYD